ncbi:iron(III) transport system substrate-binding protein [Devosia enhydra]|uniref:Iron(III) transport system substrate-binding protein n=1 Tax=Devosia enhydra TaxID=665118 RepID=A0A1K2HU17_9HYPH|nr:extracellular solute-binding protein [Devosia enhydra]SFZ81882.1 iron(III) transport system substrate-binding protein [Devosia enhydra]
MTIAKTALHRRGLLKAIGLLVAAPLLLSTSITGAMAQISEELIAAAKAEGSGTIYTSIDPTIMANVARAFQKAYGIPVDIQRASSSALAQRFNAETESNNFIADVYYSTDRAFHDESGGNGRFLPVTELAGYAEWPAEAKDETSIVIGYNPYSLIWNTQLVPEGLTSWEDLIDPKWKGKVMLTDPRIGVTSNQFYKMFREIYGDDFLRKLGENATYSPSAVPGIQQVAAGAQAIYAPGIHQVAVGLLDKGAPLGEAFPEPTISSNNIASLVATAPHPNVAKLFVSFLMTPEAQAINNQDGWSPIEGIEGTREMPQTVDIDPEETAAEVPELLQLLGLQQ